MIYNNRYELYRDLGAIIQGVVKLLVLVGVGRLDVSGTASRFIVLFSRRCYGSALEHFTRQRSHCNNLQMYFMNSTISRL